MEGSRIIRPEWNIPLEITYREAQSVAGQYGDQVMYRFTDGRITYLPAAVGQRVAQLGIGPNVAFTVLKKKGKGNATDWQVWRNSDNGATSVPAPAAPVTHQAPPSVNGASSYANGNTARPGELAVPPVVANGNGNGAGQGSAPPAAPVPPPPGPAVHQGNFQYLIEQTQGLIDAYGALLKYSNDRHGNAVKPEDVRALLTTMFIQQSGRRG